MADDVIPLPATRRTGRQDTTTRGHAHFEDDRTAFFSIACLTLGCGSIRLAGDAPTTPEPTHVRVVERLVETLPERSNVLTLIHREFRGTGPHQPVRFFLPDEAVFIDRVTNRTAWPLVYTSYRLPPDILRLTFSSHGGGPTLDRVLCIGDFETLHATYGDRPISLVPRVNDDGTCAFAIHFPQTFRSTSGDGPAFYRYRETVRIIRR